MNDATLQTYSRAIHRELEKRKTTYPKLVSKRIRAGDDPETVAEFQNALANQVYWLQMANLIICNPLGRESDQTKRAALNELVRELNMRKRVYPRLVFFKRITQEEAHEQYNVWLQMAKWFAKEFMQLDHVPKYTREKVSD